MLIFRKNLDIVIDIKRYLSFCFAINDMGNANVILGIKLIKNSNKIVFTQSHYIEYILRNFGCLDYKPISTLYDLSIKLSENYGR